MVKKFNYGASWCPYCIKMKDEITNFTILIRVKMILFLFLRAASDYDKRDECGFFQIFGLITKVFQTKGLFCVNSAWNKSAHLLNHLPLMQ